MKDIEQLIRRNIAELSPYSTARDECSCELGIFLDANESPYPNGWNRYPDPHQRRLKERISQLKGIPAANIFLGNGSDEAIDLIFRIFCEPGKDNVICIAPSYGMYAVAAQTNDIEVRSVQLREDFSLDTDALLAARDAHTKVIFLCSPNNPSGNAFPKEQILGIARESGCITVVDEAYIDFSSVPSVTDCICDNTMLIVLQTMSKARGMAALRLGMAFACERVISLMSMVKYPYNINEATQQTALSLLERSVDSQVREIVAQRERLSAALSGYGCILKVWPSEANFLLVRVDDADRLYAHFLADGIIVRNRNRVRGCEGCLRISVGLAEENDRLLSSLAQYEKSIIH